MRQSTHFCAEVPTYEGNRTYFAHFCEHVRALRLYDRKATALVADVVEDPEGKYWAWWDNKDQEFHHIFPHPGLTEMCFPYGTQAETQRDRGLKLRVRVTLLREAGPDDVDLRKKNASATQ